MTPTMPVRFTRHTADGNMTECGNEVSLVDQNGNPISPGSLGGGTQYATDSPYTPGEVGNIALAVRNDADSAIVSTDGDYTPLEVNYLGELKAFIRDGGLVTLGNKADARDTNTDATAITIMQVLKEISYMVQNPAKTPISGAALSVQVTMTVTNGAYTAQDVVGGCLSFANAVSAGGKSAVLNSLTLSGITSAIPLEVWFLNADLATPVADNAPFALVAADYPKVLGVVPIAANDYFQAGAGGTYTASVRGIGAQLKATATTIYAYVKHTTTTSPGTTTLYLTCGFEYLN